MGLTVKNEEVKDQIKRIHSRRSNLGYHREVEEEAWYSAGHKESKTAREAKQDRSMIEC